MNKRRIISYFLSVVMMLSVFNFNVKAAETSDVVDFVVTVESGRDVRVLQLTDVQIIDSDQMRTSDRLSATEASIWAKDQKEEQYKQYLRKVIPEYNPDLIIMTGDLVYGEFDDSGESFIDLVTFMDSFQIPWAPVFGNHDNESKKGVDWQCDLLENSDYCLFKQRTLTGNGNYTVGIMQDGVLKRVFFMLDSNGCGNASSQSLANGHCSGTPGFGEDQIEWYTNQAGVIKKQYPNVKLSFAFHIQPQVMADAYAKYNYPDALPINLDRVGDEGDFGYIGRKLKNAWDTDYKVWNSIKNLGADSIFVGHEHNNSASVVYQGVRLQYGQKSSTYDRLNFFQKDGTISTSRWGNTPIVGGTAIPLDKTTGEIVNPHIVYFETPPGEPEEEPLPDISENQEFLEKKITVSATSVTKVEGEAYGYATVEPNIRRMNTPDDGQRAVNYTSFNPENYAENDFIIMYALDVQEEGTYNLSAVASIRGQTYTSEWNMYINTVNGKVVKYSQVSDVDTTNYYKNVFKKFDCGNVYLKKGINTLYWKVDKNDLGSDGATLQAALDYIELTPEGASSTPSEPTPTPTPEVIRISSTGTTRIEGENYTSSTHSSPTFKELNSSANGVQIKAASTDTYAMLYNVDVETAGKYKIKVAASVMNGSSLSNWTVYANDTSNSGSSYKQEGEKFRINGIGSSGGSLHDCGTIYLNQGENIIYWSFGKAPGQNQVWAVLDYIELTPEGVTPTPPSEPTPPPVEPTPPPINPEDAILVSATGKTRIEGEAATEIVGGGYKRDMKTDDGAYALSYSPVTVADGQGYYAKYVVNVEVAGDYSLNTVASIRSQTYTSDWTIYVNTEDNAVASYVQGADVTTGWYTNNFKEYSCGTINLEAGINTIYWKVKASDAPNGKLQAALDYIELSPPPIAKISSTGSTRIEGEDATGVVGGGYNRNMKTDDGAYALTYSPVAVADGQEYYAKYVVDVEVAGDYNVGAVASIRSQTYTSDWTIYVNTEDNAVSRYTQGADITTGWYSNIFKEFSCGTIHLEAGINTIYWKVKATDAPDGKLQAALDYIELTPTSIATVTKIEDVKFSDGILTASIVSSEDLSEATVYIAVYENGDKGNLKNIEIAEMEATAENYSAFKPLELTSGNVIKVFIWNNLNLRPLCSSAQIIIQ